jgi:SAM-dependent methyltransferase
MTSAYYANVNATLLRAVPVTARRVLELGCGEGLFAEAYKRRNPRAEYTAVEIHPPSAAVARSRVDHLIEGDFEAIPDADIAAHGPFDAIIMGDVLEHLRDPWTALRRIKGLLAADGHLCACVPNIAHISAIRELLSGRWPYADSGLFDRTHLRFFTIESLQGAIRDAGLAVRKLGQTQVRTSEEGQRWIAALAEAMPKLGVDPKSFAGRAGAFQYVVTAGKREQPMPVARVCNLAMSPAFLDVRTHLPSSQLASLPDLSVTYAEKALQIPSYAPGMPRIIVQQRISESDEDVWFARLGPLMAQGWLFVAELDDHPQLFEELGRHRASRTQLPLSASHAVQTSTRPLREAMLRWNPEVAAFPNALFDLPPFRAGRDGPPRVFFGALNRERFSAQIAAALEPAIAAHPEAEWVVVHDRAFFEGLKTENKQFLPAQPYDRYLAAMAQCDIALMPLEGTFGESFKSDIKFLEASGASLTSLASPTVYGDTIRDGETGLIARDLGDWPAALSRLLGDRGLRERLARAAWEYVRDQRMFAYQAGTRRDWYLSLWERRDELTAALLQRHPRLAQYLETAPAA